MISSIDSNSRELESIFEFWRQKLVRPLTSSQFTCANTSIYSTKIDFYSIASAVMDFSSNVKNSQCNGENILIFKEL
jgi:hypothetical protein